MKKKLFTMLAICTALTLTACNSKETTNTDTTTTTTVAVQKESNTSVTATTQQATTTAPTTTEAPILALTWENSGLSYEVIETANMSTDKTTDTLYLVTVTNNHNDNTYHINTGVSYHFYALNNCYLTPGNTFEFTFLTKEDADTFVTNITATPIKDLYLSIEEPNGHWLFAPEIECTIISTEPYGNDKNMKFNFDDTSWYFDKDNGMKVAIDEWYGAITTHTLHFYDANNNLVGVYAEPIMKNFYRDEDDATILIRPDVNFTKVTAITYGQY